MHPARFHLSSSGTDHHSLMPQGIVKLIHFDVEAPPINQEGAEVESSRCIGSSDIARIMPKKATRWSRGIQTFLGNFGAGWTAGSTSTRTRRLHRRDLAPHEHVAQSPPMPQGQAVTDEFPARSPARQLRSSLASGWQLSQFCKKGSNQMRCPALHAMER